VETSPDGTGAVLAAQEVAAGASVTGYAIQRDVSNNFIANTPATWFLTSLTGAVVSADLAPSADTRSATFTGHGLGSAKMTATAGGLGSTSGILTVVSGLVGSLTVETAAKRFGIAHHGSEPEVRVESDRFAVQRDSAGKFHLECRGIVVASNMSGGVRGNDLVSGERFQKRCAHRPYGRRRQAHSNGGWTDCELCNDYSGPWQPASLSVESSATGSGAVVAGAKCAGRFVADGAYAVQRDAANNFVASVSAAWSLTNRTGNVTAEDLVPGPNNASGVFTGHAAGTARITATALRTLRLFRHAHRSCREIPSHPLIPSQTLSVEQSPELNVTLSAIAADNVEVAGVDFQLDGLSIGGEILAAPYTMNWTRPPLRTDRTPCTAVARDTSNNTTKFGACIANCQ
jgi:hypothetical protein